MKSIPNIITLSSLFTACIGVALAFSGNEVTAAWIILLCALLDFSDGLAARILDARSELGMQLDSLADLIAFGLLPASILYSILSRLSHALNPADIHFVWPWMAFFIPVFAALRLGRFNLDTRQLSGFIGLPTPGMALIIASLPLASLKWPGFGLFQTYLSAQQAAPWLISVVAGVALLCWLMVSPIRMFSLKLKRISIRDYPLQSIFLAISLVLLALFQYGALGPIMLFYLLLSLAGHSYQPGQTASQL